MTMDEKRRFSVRVFIERKTGKMVWDHQPLLGSEKTKEKGNKASPNIRRATATSLLGIYRSDIGGFPTNTSDIRRTIRLQVMISKDWLDPGSNKQYRLSMRAEHLYVRWKYALKYAKISEPHHKQSCEAETKVSSVN